MRRRHSDRRGQALVEFALVLPVLLLLTLVAVDFGRLFFSYIQVNNAAREGAAYGAGNPTDTTGIVTHATQEADAQAQAGEGTLGVTTSCADPTDAPISCANALGGSGTGNTITVSVSEPFTFLTPLINNMFGGSFQLGTSATAAVAEWAPGTGETSGNCTTPPTAVFAATVAGLTVTLDASSSSPTSGMCAISGYNWDLGDGLDPFPPVTGKQTSYTYASAGTYSITLEVTNLAGSNTTTQSVTVGVAKASPTLATVPSSGGLPGSVLTDTATLNGASAPTGSVTFNLYGPGDTTCQNAIYSVSVPLSGATASMTSGYAATATGTYLWTASYPGDGNNNAAASGCGSESATIVATLPTCSVSPSFQYQTGNAYDVAFQGSYTGQPQPSNWSWSFGDGQQGGGTPTSHQYPDTGNNGTSYTVTLTITTSTCTASTSRSIKPQK